MKGRASGLMLVEILVVAVIIALLAGLYLGLIRRGDDGEKPATPQAAMDKARGVECAANLQQLRAMLQMRQMEDEGHPAALDPADAMSRCPVTNTAYSYDASTGRVWCTTSGHETF